MAVFKCLLNTDKHGTSTTSLGSLFQCLTMLMVNKFFLNFQSEPLLAQPYAILLCSICSEITQLSCLNSPSVKTVTAKENERCKTKVKCLLAWLQQACSLLPSAIQGLNQNSESNLF